MLVLHHIPPSFSPRYVLCWSQSAPCLWSLTHPSPAHPHPSTQLRVPTHIRIHSKPIATLICSCGAGRQTTWGCHHRLDSNHAQARDHLKPISILICSCGFWLPTWRCAQSAWTRRAGSWEWRWAWRPRTRPSRATLRWSWPWAMWTGGRLLVAHTLLQTLICPLLHACLAACDGPGPCGQVDSHTWLALC